MGWVWRILAVSMSGAGVGPIAFYPSPSPQEKEKRPAETGRLWLVSPLPAGREGVGEGPGVRGYSFASGAVISEVAGSGSVGGVITGSGTS